VAEERQERNVCVCHLAVALDVTVYLAVVQEAAAVWCSGGTGTSHREVCHSASDERAIIQPGSAAAAAASEATEQVPGWQSVL